ncbi:helix-turn-helix domain-containing protein [Leisingera sp. McT4-56]|uniref:helix-turn-helix domain-containing protein n=1 Tax=Leisingera sp. McT4-56 TaxID=2881255 RepID=UPI001CF83D14|nr:helix-turn-helix transcriptional regulator [Leisingera sp. McT4-56]MCB4455468.1 short-chain fatty acyl-CoA regulator family protein [Leisingera sp. McT4-56]
MARDTLTGSRIRERRLILGLRQAELAREAGISASYLNLIEHNRRRIGGKLLVDIAGVLGVEPSMLSEGAEAALISTLREAAADSGVPVAELDRVDEFAGRFPGWAEVLAAGHRRIATLERTVETLSDRLTHDPNLAASVHEVLSTAAAIRSTASILAETGELEPEWRDRFHKNLNEDSLRLSESSRALVSFLDEGDAGEDRRGMPQEEAEAFFQNNGFHFPALEEGSAEPEDLLENEPALASEAARSLARAALEQYRADARVMPLKALARELQPAGISPVALARRFGCGLPAVLRRLAALPEEVLGHEAGLVICDASGTLLFRKPVTGFAMPRFGASCPLWPLYTALVNPHVPVRRNVVQQGRNTAAFDCLAVAWPQNQPDFGEDPLYRAVMLILPGAKDAQDPQPVGASCRICPRRGCAARREPSILKEEF